MLSEYFTVNGLKILSKVKNPAYMLPKKQLVMYSQLPDEFNRSLAKELGQKLGISQRTVVSLYSNEKVVKKLGGGMFQKRYDVFVE